MVNHDVLLRCSNCAFLNPDGASYCGMCGTRLSSRSPVQKNGKDDFDVEKEYTARIVEGNTASASSYGYTLWRKNFWVLSGLGLLAAILVAAVVIITLQYSDTVPGSVAWFVLNSLVLAFVISAGFRISLDIVRGRNPGIAGIFSIRPGRIFQVLLIMILFIFLFSVGAGGVFFLTQLGQNVIGDNGLLSGEFESYFSFWLGAAGAIIVLPLILLSGVTFSLAVLRVIDTRPEKTSPLKWALGKMMGNPWGYLRTGFNLAVTNIIGLVICYIGIIGSMGASGLVMASVYEMARLRGYDADTY